jgi:hypothetical protein
MDPHTLEVTIHPQRDGAEIAHVGVTLRFSEPPGEFAEPTRFALSMPQREDDEEGWPDAVEELSARDAEGQLPLRAEAVKGRMEWRSDRRPIGAVTVRYELRVGPGKPAAARAYAGGVQGTGATWLLLPDTRDAYRVQFQWSLGDAGDGVRATASVGARKDERVSIERLRAAVLLVGAVGTLAIDDGKARFEGAWLGQPGFDAIDALAFAARVHTKACALFHDEGPAGAIAVRAVSGGGLQGSAHAGLIWAGEATRGQRAARFAAAEQVVRSWIGGARGVRLAGAETTLQGAIAAHFARELLLRNELATPDEVAEDLREKLAGPGAAAVLYVAELDAAIRGKSGAKRTIEHVVMPLVDRARGGATVGPGALRELIGAELGAAAEARLDAVLTRGEAVKLPADAFGPCFKPAKAPAPKGAKKAGAEGQLWVRDPKVPASACAR